MKQRDIDNHKNFLLHSMLFGANQKMALPFLMAGPEGKAKIFGKMMEDHNSTPDAKDATAKLVQGLGGLSPALSKLFSDDPKAVSSHLTSSINGDVRANQHKSLASFISDAQDASASSMQQHDILDKRAGSVKIPLGQDNPFSTLKNDLQSKKYISGDNKLLDPETGDISRDADNNSWISKVLTAADSASGSDGTTSFKKMTEVNKVLDDSLFGSNPVNDKTLRQTLLSFKTDLNNAKSKGLHEVDPQLSQKFAELNSKYSPVKELLGSLSQKDEDTRLNSFLTQMIGQDGSLNERTMSSISDLLGKDNDAKDVLHMQAAKELSSAFTGSQKDPNQDAAPESEGSVPYLNQMHDVYKALPDDLKKSFVQSPQAISKMSEMVSQAPSKESQIKVNLLKQSGAFQSSQMGS